MRAFNGSGGSATEHNTQDYKGLVASIPPRRGTPAHSAVLTPHSPPQCGCASLIRQEPTGQQICRITEHLYRLRSVLNRGEQCVQQTLSPPIRASRKLASRVVFRHRPVRRSACRDLARIPMTFSRIRISGLKMTLSSFVIFESSAFVFTSRWCRLHNQRTIEQPSRWTYR